MKPPLAVTVWYFKPCIYWHVKSFVIGDIICGDLVEWLIGDYYWLFENLSLLD